MFKEGRQIIPEDENDDRPLQEFGGFDPDRRKFFKSAAGIGILIAAGSLAELYRRGYFDDKPEQETKTSENQEKKKTLELAAELKKMGITLQQENLSQSYREKTDAKKFDELVEAEIRRVRGLHHNKPVLLDKLFKTIPEILPDLIKESKDLGVSLGVALGVVLEESSGRHAAVTAAGDMGLMQLQPETAKQWKAEMQKKGIYKETVFSRLSPDDPRVDRLTNLRLGLYGIKKLSHRFGDWDLGVFAFHNGVTGTFRHFDIAQKNSRGKRINYLDVLAQADTTARGEIDKKKALYPVRVEAKLRLFRDYYLPRLISKLENK